MLDNKLQEKLDSLRHFQKYNANNIETKFIKELLRTEYIPIVPIWRVGKKPLNGMTYITHDYIIKCINEPKKDDEIKSIYDLNEEGKPYFEIIEPYIRGKFYKGLTTNFTSNSSLYDSKTHYYLGEYLRMIRDLDDINLMPYYNCWDGRYSDSLRMIDEGTRIKYEDNIVMGSNGE